MINYVDWYETARKAEEQRKWDSEKEATRLIIFEYDSETDSRTVYDIVEWEGTFNILDILKRLPEVKRLGENVLQTERHWKYVMENLGTYDMPFVIEHVRVSK